MGKAAVNKGSGMGTGENAQYVKKGGKIASKKMMYGGKPSTMKKGGGKMSKMKKGM